MTTKVLVVNLGPLPVDVQKMSVSPPVVNESGLNVRNSTVAETTRLQVGMYKEIYVYDTQEIHVEEVPHGK